MTDFSQVSPIKLAWSYGCFPPISGIESAMAEHRRATKLWDRLVDIEREHYDAAMAQARAADPRIGAAEFRIAELSAQIHIADVANRKPLFAARHEARRELWAALSEWRRLNKDKVRESEVARQASAKRARQTADAWWPNYNSVVKRYETARQECFRTGRHLRHHDDERDDGMLCVQIQRTRTGLGANPNELFGDGLSMLSLSHVPCKRRQEQRILVKMRVDAAGNDIILPAILHRPIPAGCRVKAAQLTWHRMGNQLRWKIALHLDGVSHGDKIQYSRSGAAQLRWDLSDNNGLIVCSIENKDYVLPRRWMVGMDRVEKLHAWLQESLKTKKAETKGEIREILDMPERAMLAALRERNALREWRHEWKLRWEEMHHTRDQLLQRRRDHYRVWAREIVREYPQLTMDDKRLDRIARADRHTESNRLRTRVCPHSLRQEIIHQANKIGAAVMDASGKVLTKKESVKLDFWARRKAAKAERSQKVLQAIDQPAIKE